MADGVSDPGPKPPGTGDAAAGRNRHEADSPAPPHTRGMAPDDRHTTILPPVRDVAPPQWRDPAAKEGAWTEGHPVGARSRAHGQ